MVRARILESLNGCLTELCASDFYWIFFSSFAISFPRFSKGLFKPMNILQLRHSQNNWQVWLDKLNLMWEELSYQIINTSAVNQAVIWLVEVCKNHYKKEKISVGGSEQCWEAFFKIHLKETWLNIFVLLLVALNFSTFAFSVGIKLFIQHPVELFGILILLEQFNDFVQFPLWCIPKDRQLCLQKYLKYRVLYPVIA